jgi:3-oxoacyl-[acyl-carrier protein] reductase
MNQLDLKGRSAIVTGAASGLGFAIAERLVASGAVVLIWDIDGEAGAGAAKKLGGRSIIVDVSDPNSVTAAVQASLALTPTIDILVNNAGITGPNVKLWDYPIADWNRVFAVNVHGVFHCCRAVVPPMREQNYGRIVNIASVAGKDGNPNASAYSASKAAAIRVNCVTPAAVRTPLFSQMTQAHIDYMLSKIPMGRFGEPEEIAALVAWLATEECSFSTGAVFDLSGGRSTY